MKRECFICGKRGKVRGINKDMENVYLCDTCWKQYEDKQGQTVRLEAMSA